MKLWFLVLIVACGKTDKADKVDKADKADKADDQAPPVADSPCVAARDKYLAWEADRVKSALDGAGVPEGQRAAMQAEADKEALQARDRFLDACAKLGSALDVSCFEQHGYDRDRTRAAHCKDVRGQLESLMFHGGR